MNLTALRKHGDIYLCLGVGMALIAQALLGSITGHETEATRIVSLALGMALLVLPGYSLGLLLEMDRYGIETFAGMALALSLAILALTGTGVWLISHRFSVSLLEALVGGFILVVSIAVIWRRSADRVEIAPRWSALALIGLPIALAVVAVSTLGAVSPSTRFTEFWLVRTKPAMAVAIVNQEGKTERYSILIERGAERTRLPQVTVPAGARWTGSVSVPVASTRTVQLFLYRIGDSGPPLHLSVRLVGGGARHG